MFYNLFTSFSQYVLNKSLFWSLQAFKPSRQPKSMRLLLPCRERCYGPASITPHLFSQSWRATTRVLFPTQCRKAISSTWNGRGEMQNLVQNNAWHIFHIQCALKWARSLLAWRCNKLFTRNVSKLENWKIFRCHRVSIRYPPDPSLLSECCALVRSINSIPMHLFLILCSIIAVAPTYSNFYLNLY